MRDSHALQQVYQQDSVDKISSGPPSSMKPYNFQNKPDIAIPCQHTTSYARSTGDATPFTLEQDYQGSPPSTPPYASVMQHYVEHGEPTTRLKQCRGGQCDDFGMMAIAQHDPEASYSDIAVSLREKVQRISFKTRVTGTAEIVTASGISREQSVWHCKSGRTIWYTWVCR